ncbi:hypothetical protein DTO96_101557 [Ephemeroptericola cinctiostellae]|uniref:Uncharacterized protein n=1 Tax=Ephemeroptericola cinctiostellae TaxID=2268024 RepID=A0A345DBS9_9BURK|nr:hypothetical protein DTO96_101557 [Ephemeroptericola cinctiostellae]
MGKSEGSRLKAIPSNNSTLRNRISGRIAPYYSQVSKRNKRPNGSVFEVSIVIHWRSSLGIHAAARSRFMRGEGCECGN